MVTKHSRYQKNIKWSLLASLATAIFQFAQMAVFARLAGPSALGDYALAAAAIGFLSPLTDVGLSQSVVQADHISRVQWKKLAASSLALGIMAFAALWLIGPAMATWYGREDLPGLMLLMGSSMLFTPFGALRAALLTKSLQFDALAKIEVSAWAVSFFATSVLAFHGWSTWALALAFLLRNAMVTIGSLFAHPNLPEGAPQHTEIKSHLRFGFFDLSARWAEFLANYLDKLIVGKWLGVEALGFYNLAFTFLMLPTARLASVVTRVSFPIYAQLKGKKEELQGFFVQSTQQIALVLFPIYLVLILFPKEILLLIYGEKWLPALPLLVAFGVAGFVRTLSTPFPQLMRGLGKPQLWLGWLVVYTGILNGVLCLVLWNFQVVEAAAWSRMVVKIVAEIPLLWGLAYWVGLRFSPVLNFAGKWVAWLAPVAFATWLVGNIPGTFWAIFSLKLLVFMAGIAWLGCKGPLRSWKGQG